MNIVAINASPKPDGGLSGAIIRQLEALAGGEIPSHQATGLVLRETPKEALDAMCSADILLIVFPLYVDSLPSPLIELLTRLERAGISKPMVYAVANCGFYEAHHNDCALEMIRHFANRTGLTFGGALAIGCGPMMNSAGNWANGPFAPVHLALMQLLDAMRERKIVAVAYTAPALPRVLYTVAAHAGWRFTHRKSGSKIKLRAKPYA